MGAAKKVYDFPTYEAYIDYIELEKQRYDSSKKLEKKIKLENAVKAKFIRQISVIIVATVALVSTTLVSNGFLYKEQYELNTYKMQIDGLNVQISEYKANLEEAYAFKNIESIAVQNLGMQYPKKKQIVRINSSWNYKVDNTGD